MTNGEQIRVQKAIAAAGLMSRRAAEQLIEAGRVSIDGRRAKLGDRVDPNTQRVEVDGAVLPISPGLVTYLLYKPPGVVSTARDPQRRPTVVDLVPASPRVVPVGRLDADSEGLLLLTNDGELALRMSHPRYGVGKTYAALVEGVPTRSDLAKLRAGVILEDGPAKPMSARLRSSDRGRALIELVMGEGRKREVRRMLDALGFPVVRLVRIAIGPLRDRSLRAGQWRRLTSAEVSALYRAADHR